jgi:hypothetical protein
MWPAAVVVGMLVLLGAIGTATAPTASAAPGFLCSGLDGLIGQGFNGSTNVLGIQGPFPNYNGYGDNQDSNLMLVGHTYLFAIVNEDAASPSPPGINVSVDDEEGDADHG